MRFASLGSGSKGNATLVSAGDTLLLVDCGFTYKETEQRLARLGVEAAAIDAILVTHEHGDHCSGVAALSKRHRIPVYLSHGTAASGRISGGYQQIKINAGDVFSVGDVAISAVPVPHDAREPTQFIFTQNRRRLGILTDLGSITPHVVEAYGSCHGLLLEFNHDTELLMRSSYPAALKRRVRGDYGHLNNDQAVELLSQLDTSCLNTLVAAHLSEQNNSPQHTLEALDRAADCHQARVILACQSAGFDWVSVADDLDVDASVAPLTSVAMG